MMFLSPLLRQLETNCVFEMTCLPDWSNPLDALRIWQELYGIPNAVILAVLLGAIVTGLYIHNPKQSSLAIMGIYVTSIVSSTRLNEAYIAPQYHAITYLIIIAIASVFVLLVVKTIREA